MITILPIPVATPAADQQQLLVQLKEALCQAYCTSSGIRPTFNVTFTPGIATTRTVSGTTTTYDVILPITVTGTITYRPKNCCNAVTRMFTETFNIGFTGLTTAPTTFTITTGLQTSSASNIKSCNRAYGYDINTAITVTAA